MLIMINMSYKKGTFGDDLSFLRKHLEPIVLKEGKRQIMVSPEFQGRVFTSTSRGLEGDSYGWFNKNIISSDSAKLNMSKVGGASRIWFGPDQGPNTVFVRVDSETNEKVKGAPVDLDEVQFQISKKSNTSVAMGSKMHIENNKGFQFYLDVNRKVELLDFKDVISNLHISLNDKIEFVAFKAETTMTNIGNENWSVEKGLISLWELGCMIPSSKTTVIIPLKGKIEKATIYFTEIDSTRIVIKNNVMYYRADANYFNKIGTLPENTLPYFGSYSPELNRLTVVKFSFNNDTDYVNSHEKFIENQLRGDVINVFNDGIWGDIGPFGPFYELETSSPAKALKVGESMSHIHETYHFEGSQEDLSRISMDVFGVALETVEKALS